MPVDPPPTGPTLWADASNWTGNLTDQGCADLKAAGYVGVIIQAITGNDGHSYTRQQLDACVRNGLRIQGYCWVFHSVPSSSMWSRLTMFDGYTLEALWADVEANDLTRADVDRDLALMDVYFGQPVGCYSGKWFFDQQGWSQQTWWSDRDLWISIYDGVADPDVNFVPFHGWTHATMKQWAGTSSIGSVNQIDLNISR